MHAQADHTLNDDVDAGEAAARAGARPPRDAEAETGLDVYPPLGAFHAFDAVDLHVIRRGRGRPIVLIHGSFASTYDYTLSPIWPELISRFDVTAYDRPGRGHSRRPRDLAMTLTHEARMLQRLIDHQGLERPIIVGHSSGGAVALRHALLHRDQAAGYVLLAPVAFGRSLRESRMAMVVRLFAASGLSSLLMERIVPRAARLAAPFSVRRAFAPDQPTDAFRAFNGCLGVRPDAFRAELRDLHSLPFELEAMAEAYPTLTAPITIIASPTDRLLRFAEHAGPLRETIPHATMVQPAGAGHMVQVTAWREVAAAIDAMAQAKTANDSQGAST